MCELLLLFLAAFLLDLLIGDPPFRWHPVRVIGSWILICERALRKAGFEGIPGGLFLVALVQLTFVGLFLTLALFLRWLHPVVQMGFDLLVCKSCIALKDMVRHIEPIIPDLGEENLPRAGERLSMVVGRDVKSLDKAGVSRAAVETVAENFVDGFFSPLFWYFAGGLAAFLLGLPVVITALGFMLGFKVTSTLDSMVGYKDPLYLYFGRAGAKLDDAMNFVPARLSLIVLFIGSSLSGLHPVAGIKTALRDRLKHDSPNAAHAESFFAGALSARLGGPTPYPDGIKHKEWLAQGHPDPGPAEIRGAMLLLKCSAWTSVLLPLALIPFLL